MEIINFKSEIARRNMKYKDVAMRVGIPLPTFYKKLRDNSFRMVEAAKIADVLDRKLILVSK